MAERSIAFGLFAKDNASGVFKKVGVAAQKSAEAVDKATEKLAKATLSQADAAGKVRVAETKLKELRDSGKASATQLAKAEEDLSSAQRKQEQATKDVDRATKNLESAQSSATTKTHHFGDAASKAGHKLGRMAVTAAKAFAAVAAAAAFAAVKIGYDSVKAALEDEAAARKLAVTLRNVTGATKAQTKAVEEYIDKAELRFNIDDDKLRPALSRLIISTHSVSKAQKLLGLAMDVSAGSGKDLNTVVAAFGKALDGNWGALGRLGVGLDKNLLKQKKATDNSKQQKAALDAQARAQLAYNQAVDKANASKTLASQQARERAALRLDQANQRVAESSKVAAVAGTSLDDIWKKLSVTFKGAGADAADTAAGKLGRLEKATKQVKEQIGYLLLPFVEQLAGSLTKLAPVIENWIDQFGPKLSGALSSAQPYLKSLSDWFQNTALPAFQTVSDWFQNVGLPAMQALWEWIQGSLIPGLSATLTPVIRGLADVWGTISTKIDENKEKLKPLFALLKTVADFVLLKLAPAFGTQLGASLSAFAVVIGWLIDKFASLVDWLGKAWEAISKITKAIADSPIGTAIGAIIERLLPKNIPGRATGGPVTSGTPYMVGERGPELFVPQASGTIIPNGRNANTGNTVQVIVQGNVYDKEGFMRAVQEAQRILDGRNGYAYAGGGR